MSVTDVPLMNPVLRRGRSYLDREVLPGDENESRVTALLAEATERGLAGVVLFAAAHLPDNLVYYANYTPTTFHGAVLARPGEPPILLAGKGGARDHPYIRTLSWVGDIRYAADYGATVDEIVSSWGGPETKVGVAGLETTLPHAVGAGVTAALGDRLVPIDDMVAAQRRHKSAREQVVLTKARALAESAAATAAASYHGGAGRRTALAAADHAARAGGAHDCRITVGTAAGVGTLAEIDDATATASALIAVEYLGYWGVAAVDLAGADPDVGGLEAVVGGLRPGLLPGDAVGTARDTDLYLINGIGTAPAELPGPGDSLAEGDVVSIVRVRRGLDGTRFAVRTARVGAGGGREL